jgi:hypothetical protein
LPTQRARQGFEPETFGSVGQAAGDLGRRIPFRAKVLLGGRRSSRRRIVGWRPNRDGRVSRLPSARRQGDLNARVHGERRGLSSGGHARVRGCQTRELALRPRSSVTERVRRTARRWAGLRRPHQAVVETELLKSRDPPTVSAGRGTGAAARARYRGPGRADIRISLRGPGSRNVRRGCSRDAPDLRVRAASTSDGWPAPRGTRTRSSTCAPSGA